MSLTTKLGAATDAARLAGYQLIERVRPRRTAAVGKVPASADALNTQWLTATLCGGVPGAAVTDFELATGSAGTTSRRALTVHYNEAGAAADLPTALFTKATPDLKTKLFTGLTNLSVGEANFYTMLRPRLDIESPYGYYAAFDRRTCRSLIILEDIARTRAATFADPLDTRIDRARAEDMIGLMAGYHAAFWADPGLDGEFAWLRSSPEWQAHLDSMINTRAMVHRGLQRAESVLPAELLQRSDQIWPAFVRSLELKTHRPITLLHHDVHLNNWYITGSGRMGLYDWQTVVKGVWAIDVSYALNSALSVEDRRSWLGELLDLYLERLRSSGVAPPTAHEAWQRYRQQTIHGLIFWLATLGAGALQPDLHPPERCRVVIERTARAAADLDSLNAL